MVEFALVAPIFFLILFAIIQLGLIFAGQNGLVNGVRETARYAAPYRVVDASGAGNTCTNQVLDKIDAILGSELIGFSTANRTSQVTYSWKSDSNGDGKYYVVIKVHVDYKFPLYVPIVGNFLDGMDGVSDGKLKLSGQEEMRVENDPLATTYSTTTPTCHRP